MTETEQSLLYWESKHKGSDDCDGRTNSENRMAEPRFPRRESRNGVEGKAGT